MWHQTFEWNDLFLIGLLVLLEGVLSIDNALVLGLIARRVPKALQQKVLSYGLVGALVFRIIAIFAASFLLKSKFVKLLGGAYLIYLAGKQLLFPKHRRLAAAEARGDAKPLNAGPGSLPGIGSGAASSGEDSDRTTAVAPAHAPDAGQAASTSAAQFWSTVLAVELTDIAFAVDSILAAIALVSEQTPASPNEIHPKLWVVVTGGMIGVVLVRFAASLFIKLLNRFGRFEFAAYLLVLIIGLKLLLEWAFDLHFHDFHSPWAWSFWAAMAAAFCIGFIPGRRRAA